MGRSAGEPPRECQRQQVGDERSNELTGGTGSVDHAGSPQPRLFRCYPPLGLLLAQRRDGCADGGGDAMHRFGLGLLLCAPSHPMHTLPSLPSFPHTLLPRRGPPGRTWCRHSSAVWMSMVSYRPSIGMRGIAGHLRGGRARCAHTVATDRGDGHLPPPPASPLWRIPPRHRHDLPLCRDTGWSGFHLKYQGEYPGVN